MPNFLDLFAGAGGLSEGFVQAGYKPIAHVEMNAAACFTLKTRAVYRWLKKHNRLDIYERYLKQEISREALYRSVPNKILRSVLNFEISDETLPAIFDRIDKILNAKNLDLIVGGPPCQAYSLAGRSRSETGMLGDKRNYLYKLYAEFLKRYNPSCFVFENVLGLLSAKEENGTMHLDNMCELFKQCGYSVEYNVLNANDYGVLQKRKRIILIGLKGSNLHNFYPTLRKRLFKNVTVSEIFKDLPPITAGGGTFLPIKPLAYHGEYLNKIKIKDTSSVTFHIARPNTKQDLKIYKIVVKAWNKKGERLNYSDLPDNIQTHNNTSSFVDRFKVVAGNLSYSQTVVAHVCRDGHYYIHPDIKQNRSLTPRELARLQTFPDSYYFESATKLPGRTAAFKQIGNAVPVRLAYVVAKALKKLFK